MRRSISIVCVALAMAAALGLLSAPGRAQVREFDFYSDFRAWRMALPADVRNQVDEVVRRYRDKLTKDGIDAAEIDRRTTIVRTRRNELEADFWNRFFTAPNPGFNTEPNAYLVSIAGKRAPGRALDIGMGEGRNALYLAKLGWDVTGFDPAEKAVALAQERARTLGVKLTTKVALDTEFDFGAEQWDLILYSWVSPFASAKKAIAGLKPGGIIVLESGTMLFPRKDVLPDLFAPLRVIENTEIHAASDFFERREMDILRFVAEKPRR